jgi:DNA-binding NarL/FixJ family response regulator
LRRSGVPVVAVHRSLGADPASVRALGASAAAWHPADVTQTLLRLRGPLSPAEATVLRLASEGYTNTRIARELKVSVSAVQSRLESCFAKLGAADRAHAVAIALRQRWIA